MKTNSSDPQQTGNSFGSASKSDEPVDTRELLERVGGDQDLLRHLIGIFLQDYPEVLVEIKKSVASANADTLHRFSHRLKGTLGNFAAHKAFQHAQELESISMTGNMSDAEECLMKLEAEIARVGDTLGLLAQENE